MKRICLLLLLGCSMNVFAQKTFTDAQINDVLSRAEQFIRHIQTISYYSNYREVHVGDTDSVLAASGQIWMQAVSSDSIFHAKFHINGNIADGAYDYFYDGINSYELDHFSKEIILTNPRLFENDEHNPSKARAAMLPFSYYLTNQTFAANLLKEHPLLSMEVQPAQYIIKLDYPVDKNGDKEVKSIYLDKNSFAINKVSIKSNWNGARFRTDIIFSNLVVNNKDIEPQIPLLKSYKDYTVTEIKPQKRLQPPGTKLIGKVASPFQYKTFDNQEVSLASLKGKYVLLDFWESWCGQCILGMPKMESLYETYHPKGLALLSITTENQEKIKDLRNVNKLQYPGLIADKKILDDYKVFGRPTFILINPAGEVVAFSEGDLNTIAKQLDAVLK